MDHLLYYPYINLPRTDWTLRTLLYYESVGSIVPNAYFYQPDQYESFMRELVHSRLVIPIDPMEVLNRPWEVTKPFIDHIEENKEKIKKARKRFAGEKSKRDTYGDALPAAKIHKDKFHHEIFYSLKDMGLATPQAGGWYAVERKTADQMMQFLATVIAKKQDMLPTTNAMGKKFYRRAGIVAQKKRQTILNRLIPMPEQMDLKKLKGFKEKHLDLLDAFKTRVELLVHEPNLLEGTVLFDLKVKELQQRRDELTAKMTESQFGNILWGSVSGLINAGVGIAGAGTIGALAGAFPGFANAVHSALKIESPERIFDQSGLKYLALAEKRLWKPVE